MSDDKYTKCPRCGWFARLYGDWCRNCGALEAEARECQHGWRGRSAPAITDPCPSCGLKSLFVGDGGGLTCASLRCKSPCVEETWKRLIHDAVAEERKALRIDLTPALSALQEIQTRLQRDCARGRPHDHATLRSVEATVKQFEAALDAREKGST